MIKNKKLLFTLVIYTVIFYTVWAVYQLICTDMLYSVTDNMTASIIHNAIIKNLVWTVPALLLAKHFESELYVGLKDMFRFKKSDLIYLAIAFALGAIVLIRPIIAKHGLYISENFKPSGIVTVIFVGITEEAVFRGWLLNSTIKNADTDTKQYIAIAVNSVMFLMIHFPIWIHDGVFVSNFSSMAFIFIIVLSVIFSVCFIKTKNIWIPVIMHMFYDLMVFMFV